MLSRSSIKVNTSELKVKVELEEFTNLLCDARVRFLLSLPFPGGVAGLSTQEFVTHNSRSDGANLEGGASTDISGVHGNADTEVHSTSRGAAQENLRTRFLSFVVE